jgi:hypothetical protein
MNFHFIRTQSGRLNMHMVIDKVLWPLLNSYEWIETICA